MEKRILVNTVGENWDLLSKIKEFAPDVQRWMVFSKKFTGMTYKEIYENDEKICFSSKEVVVGFGTAFYRRDKVRSGMSYDKKTRKVKTWFGKTGKNIHAICELFKYTGNEWVCILPHSITQVITDTTLGLILSKKITNPTQLIRRWVSTSLKIKGLSPKYFYKLAQEAPNTTLAYYSRFLKQAKNPAAYLKHIVEEGEPEGSQYKDILDQAMMLGEKVDHRWSKKRLEEEHQRMTRKLMEYEVMSIPDTDFGYGKIPELPEGFCLITSDRELFREGKEMSHCVYTNYRNRIKDLSYFVISYTPSPIHDYSKRFTIGIRKAIFGEGTNEFVIDQICGLRNASCPADIREIIESIVSEKSLQLFFKRITTNLQIYAADLIKGENSITVAA